MASSKAERIIEALSNRAGFDDWWISIHADNQDEIIEEIWDIVEEGD